MPFSTSSVLVAALVLVAEARIYNLQTDAGALPNDASLTACNTNGAAFNATLAKMVAGDVLVIPNGSFYMQGGIKASGLKGITISFDGTVILNDDIKHWPRHGPGNHAKVLHFMEFSDMVDFTITSANTNTGRRGIGAGSNGAGLIDGRGHEWWGFPGVGYLERGENRPRLLQIDSSTNVKVENIFFKNSPYWTTSLNVNGLEVKNCRIEAYRVSETSHTAVDMTAFNTDGFDITGNNLHVHDSTVFNQDDSFCVKDGTTNVVVENVDSSGLGLTIGSIASNVNNVTFRNIYMKNTVKGVYMKFRGAGTVSNVLYENIVMDAPEQYPIWIGPAQQSDSDSPCAPHPCSLCWPGEGKCNAPINATYINITMRNITVNNPKGNPGVILANASSPMQNVVFDGVVVNHPTHEKPPYWGAGYLCEGVQNGIATGTTHPVPPCFKDMTDAAVAAAAAAAAAHPLN